MCDLAIGDLLGFEQFQDAVHLAVALGVVLLEGIEGILYLCDAFVGLALLLDCRVPVFDDGVAFLDCLLAEFGLLELFFVARADGFYFVQDVGAVAGEYQVVGVGYGGAFGHDKAGLLAVYIYGHVDDHGGG